MSAVSFHVRVVTISGLHHTGGVLQNGIQKGRSNASAMSAREGSSTVSATPQPIMMTMAISKAAEGGARAVICASTGNTSASASAYAVKAGMGSAVLVPQGKIAMC